MREGDTQNVAGTHTCRLMWHAIHAGPTHHTKSSPQPVYASHREGRTRPWKKSASIMGACGKSDQAMGCSGYSGQCKPACTTQPLLSHLAIRFPWAQEHRTAAAAAECPAPTMISTMVTKRSVNCGRCTRCRYLQGSGANRKDGEQLHRAELLAASRLVVSLSFTVDLPVLHGIPHPSSRSRAQAAAPAACAHQDARCSTGQSEG